MNNDYGRPWLNATMPHLNFASFSIPFSIADALRVIQDNLRCPLISTNQINSISLQSTGQSNFSVNDSTSSDSTGDQPIRL
jgi:hypothetical protein